MFRHLEDHIPEKLISIIFSPSECMKVTFRPCEKREKLFTDKQQSKFTYKFPFFFSRQYIKHCFSIVSVPVFQLLVCPRMLSCLRVEWLLVVNIFYSIFYLLQEPLLKVVNGWKNSQTSPLPS